MTKAKKIELCDECQLREGDKLRQLYLDVALANSVAKSKVLLDVKKVGSLASSKKDKEIKELEKEIEAIREEAELHIAGHKNKEKELKEEIEGWKEDNNCHYCGKEASAAACELCTKEYADKKALEAKQGLISELATKFEIFNQGQLDEELVISKGKWLAFRLKHLATTKKKAKKCN